MGADNLPESPYRQLYQLVALDRNNTKHVIFVTADRDKAIDKLEFLDEMVHSAPNLLMKVEGFQSIELQKVEVINRITWHEVRS